MLRFVIVLAIGASLLIVALFRQHHDPHRIAQLIANPNVSGEWAQIVDSISKDLVVGTPFESNWQIMKQPDGKKLSIVIFDSRRLPQALSEPRYQRNCSYVGIDFLMVCDVALFDVFLSDRDLDKIVDAPSGDLPTDQLLPLREKTPGELRTLRQQLVRWVLAHEIGHILAGHGARHFSPNTLEQLTSPQSLSQQQELEADAFLVDRFRKPLGADRGLYDFLLDLLIWEIRRKACPDRSPLQHCPNMTSGVGIPLPALPLLVSRSGSHPEYLIRLIRLIDASDQQLGFGDGQISYLIARLKEQLLSKAVN